MNWSTSLSSSSRVKLLSSTEARTLHLLPAFHPPGSNLSMLGRNLIHKVHACHIMIGETVPNSGFSSHSCDSISIEKNDSCTRTVLQGSHLLTNSQQRKDRNRHRLRVERSRCARGGHRIIFPRWTWLMHNDLFQL